MRTAFALAGVLVAALSVAGCASAPRGAAAGAPAAKAATAQAALDEAARRSRHGLVFSGSRQLVGRVVALGGEEYRVGRERIAVSQVDPFFVRRQEVRWRPVAIGAGIGAVIGVIIPGAVYPVLGSDLTPPAARWAVGGALTGGVLGIIVSGRVSDEVWDRRWPIAADER